MPTAMQLQNKVAKVPSHARVAAKKGGDYPLSEDEMSLVRRVFRIAPAPLDAAP
jgi:hypothetical protein